MRETASLLPKGGDRKGGSMKNLKEVSRRSEQATWYNPVLIYYDYCLDEVLTKDMITDKHTHLLECTNLIRHNTEKEIKMAVYRALMM